MLKIQIITKFDFHGEEPLFQEFDDLTDAFHGYDKAVKNLIHYCDILKVSGSVEVVMTLKTFEYDPKNPKGDKNE